MYPVAYQNWLVVERDSSLIRILETESPGDAGTLSFGNLQSVGEKMVSISGLTGRIYFVLALRKMPILYQLKNPSLNLDISICHIIGMADKQMKIIYSSGRSRAYIYARGCYSGTVGSVEWRYGYYYTCERRYASLSTNARRAKFSALKPDKRGLAEYESRIMRM